MKSSIHDLFEQILFWWAQCQWIINRGIIFLIKYSWVLQLKDSSLLPAILNLKVEKKQLQVICWYYISFCSLTNISKEDNSSHSSDFGWKSFTSHCFFVLFSLPKTLPAVSMSMAQSCWIGTERSKWAPLKNTSLVIPTTVPVSPMNFVWESGEKMRNPMIRIP